MLVTLLAGLLPAWMTNGPMPVQALPGAQRGNESVIVEVARGANPEAVARALGVVPTHVYSQVFQGFAGELPTGATRAAERQGGVVRIWPDLLVRAEAQKLPTGVDRINANENPWADIHKDGGNIDADVAVLDSGIAKHRELSIAGGKACVGSDFKDGNGHGTHVAGTIAAKDNNKGVVGVAPGARLWAVKVLDDSGSGRISEVICGLDWVYNHSDTIDVVNMSLSADAVNEDQLPCTDEMATPLHKAICRVVIEGDVPVIVAAGNQGRDASTRAPATYDEVITVSAFADFDGEPGGNGVSSCAKDDDTFASLSNFGQDIDISAPGMCIRSTWRGDKYKSLNGTSMATPHVTGAAALYLAQGPGPRTPDGVRTWLLTQASQPQDSEFGFTGDPDGFPEPVLYLPSA